MRARNWNRAEITTNPRLAGQVVRYHTWPTLRSQTIAEHCWQIMRIYCELFGMPGSEAWHYMLHHDTGEIATGDIPFPVKSKNPLLKKEVDRIEYDALCDMNIPQYSFAPHIRWRIKICDLLEMMEFGLQEECLGNTFAAPITKATAEAVRTMTEAVPEGVKAEEVAKIKQKVMSTLSYYKGERQHVTTT